MTKYPISQRELADVRREMAALRNEWVRLGQQLGEIMSSSGSFAAKTPGFSDTEDRIRVIEQKIADLEILMSITETSRAGGQESVGSAAMYTGVEVIDSVGKMRRYYLCHRSVPPCMAEYQATTPRSPMGRALLGRKVGDAIEIMLPQGREELKITALRPVPPGEDA